MAATTTKGGIREEVRIAGYAIGGGPFPLALPFTNAQTLQRAKSARLLDHRLFPYDGAPDLTRKGKFSVSWETLNGEDIDLLNDLIAFGGPIDVTFWRPITESFWCAAGTPSGILSRRDAYTVYAGSLPAGSGTDYQPVRRLSLRGACEPVTLGSSDAKNRTPWSSADTLMTAQRVWVAYYPVYSMKVSEDQTPFSEPHVQGQTLVMEEE